MVEPVYELRPTAQGCWAIQILKNGKVRKFFRQTAYQNAKSAAQRRIDEWKATRAEYIKIDSKEALAKKADMHEFLVCFRRLVGPETKAPNFLIMEGKSIDDIVTRIVLPDGDAEPTAMEAAQPLTWLQVIPLEHVSTVDLEAMLAEALAERPAKQAIKRAQNKEVRIAELEAELAALRQS